MEFDTDAIGGLISQFYAAGQGDIPFATVLGNTAQTFGAVAALLFEVDRDSADIVRLHQFGVDESIDDFKIKMHKAEPRLVYSIAHPEITGRLILDHEFWTDREMDRNKFINWSEQANDIRYVIGLRMYDAEARSVFASVAFSRLHGHPTAEEVAAYGTLVPHLAAAYRLSRRLERAGAERAFASTLTDNLPWGVVALDRAGRVVLLNAQARKIIAAKDGLRMEDGFLRALHGADDRSLTRLVATVLANARGEDLRPGRALAIARAGNDCRPLAVEVLPYHDTPGQSGDVVDYAALVYVSDLEETLAVRGDLLADAFGLSPKEGELARLLGAGHSLRDAAEQVAIAHNTARNHLRNVLWKTGTRNQVDLARLLARLPKPV